MRKILSFGLLILCGCSNAPIAGMMDLVCPSRAGRPPAIGTQTGANVAPLDPLLSSPTDSAPASRGGVLGVPVPVAPTAPSSPGPTAAPAPDPVTPRSGQPASRLSISNSGAPSE